MVVKGCQPRGRPRSCGVCLSQRPKNRRETKGTEQIICLFRLRVDSSLAVAVRLCYVNGRVVKQKIANAWFAFLAFLARNRILVVSTFGVLAPAFLAQYLRAITDPTLSTWPKFWLSLYIPAQLLLILASIAPTRYATLALLESILPSVHAVLGLKNTDRVTIHHIRNKKDQTYEQLTNYHPTKIGRGRVFHFTHGIVGKCLTTRSPQAYSVQTGTDFVTAMKRDWSFTEDELGRLTQDRRSFFAFPIGYNGQYAKAILYMDSCDPNTFTIANKETIAKKIEELFLPQLNQLSGA